MQKHYCSYKLSILAKKAGFDEYCTQGYEKETFFDFEREFKNTYLDLYYGGKHAITAPELNHLQQWVYEKFAVWVTAKSIAREKATMFTQSNSLNPRDFDCPYKALEAGLLEFLKSKTQ